MGLLDFLGKKKDESSEAENAKEAKAAKESKEAKKEAAKEDAASDAKYEGKECSMCGGMGAEKKWMGQYWHKKCLRSMKKGARKMI
ncbi:MAG: hypothetical protein V1494_06320 [Candidatus Diapherotrites archaeon]